jgi:hypothetical protein
LIRFWEKQKKAPIESVGFEGLGTLIEPDKVRDKLAELPEEG